MAGANIPVNGLIHALGHAACVMIGVEQPNGFAVPSTSVFNGSGTALIVGADDSIIHFAVEKDVLYGPYHNFVNSTGVGALWNGYIDSVSNVKATFSTPSVVVDGKAVATVQPQNLANPVNTIIFYTKDAAPGSISEQDAVQRYP